MAAGLSYFLWLSSIALAVFSIGNAIYCFTRKRRYRLFETNIEVEPQTPSARRVPVDSSPIASSPLRVLGNIIDPFRNDAASRAHPDETRDVWEVGVWDPSPLSLHLFAIFSPVHVAIYFLSLPVRSGPALRSGSPLLEIGTQSSAAVYFTVILTQILLSVQIICLKSWFVQQAHDLRIISKEVMHEYDQKYVHPRLNVIKRDVAIQCSTGTSTDFDVQIYTPTFNRAGFKTFANPNYAELTMQTPVMQTGMGHLARSTGFPSTPNTTQFQQPMPVRRLQFNVGESRATSNRRSTMSSSSSSTSAPTSTDEDIGRRIKRESSYGGREGIHSGYDQTVRRTTTQSVDPTAYEQPRQPRMGTEGLVDWSRNNSRGLSPSKMSTPLRKGSTIRGSTYAESLGTPLGTPVRRRQF